MTFEITGPFFLLQLSKLLNGSFHQELVSSKESGCLILFTKTFIEGDLHELTTQINFLIWKLNSANRYTPMQ